MDFEQRYNKIIEQIEASVSFKPDAIIYNLSQQSGYSAEALGYAFRFILDTPLRDYIVSRKLVSVIKDKLLNGLTISDAIGRSTFPDTPTFSKAFKKAFGIPPKEATLEWLELQKPLTLEQLMSKEILMESTSTAETISTTQSNSSQFKNIYEAFKLNASYGFSENVVELICRLSKKYNVSLSKVFEFIEEINLEYGNIQVTRRLGNSHLDKLALLYFTYHLSVSEATKDLNDIFFGVNLFKLPPQTLDVYYSTVNDDCGFTLNYAIDLANALNDRGWGVSDLEEVYIYCDDLLDGIINAERYSFGADYNELNTDFNNREELEGLEETILLDQSSVSRTDCDFDPDYNVLPDSDDYYDLDDVNSSSFDF